MMVIMVFFAFAAGSGESNSTRDSVTIDSDGNVVSGGNNSGDNNAAALKYEITDTDFDYYKNSLGRYEYYGYVEIKNTGTCDIYMQDCVFDLEDNDGHLLQSDTLISHCPEVIAPGEKGYFYNSLGASSIDSSVSLDNGVRLVPQMKLAQAKGKPVSYPVSDVSVRKDDYGYVKVTGRVENTTEKDINYMYIHVLFYDKDGKVIAITGTSVTDIGAGMKGSFDMTAMFVNDNLKFEDIKETKVIAEDSYYQW